MRIAAKRPPERDELREAEEFGYEHVELYLEKQHLDRYEVAVEHLEDTDLEIVSVHTPHVPRSEREYLQRAAYLADRCDALLVFHSGQIPLRWSLEEGRKLGYDRVAYEANPGVSRHAIENIVLGQNRKLVLDAAHLYIASKDFEEDFAALLEHAAHVHLCDATLLEDGLGFGEGGMDVERMIEQVLDSSYDGDVVLEVMPEHQEKAKQVFERVREGYDG
ncbi:MAG: TIM barrel protein [Candidatus Nanohaloarchaea archaeon]|nr:TIM barrel protein [Candidatus Nanohaloarchaea archaeon]